MLYQFKCKICDHEQEEVFAVSDYNKRVTDNGRLKRKRCEKCRTISLYRHIMEAPSILGGTSGYVSVERWLQKNPDHTKRKEETLNKRLSDRHRKRVLDRINKSVAGDKKDQRFNNYGHGQTEEKLSSD